MQLQDDLASFLSAFQAFHEGSSVGNESASPATLAHVTEMTGNDGEHGESDKFTSQDADLLAHLTDCKKASAAKAASETTPQKLEGPLGNVLRPRAPGSS